MTDSRPRHWWTLAVFVALVAATASFGATFKPGAWYAALAKPAWTPPNWVFAPVWTLLYVMMAVAGWLVWRSGERGLTMGLWLAGLALNAAWSWLFFGQHWIGVALADIMLLLATIIGFALRAWPTRKLAALLYLPYMVWVGYATALNAAIWQLNR